MKAIALLALLLAAPSFAEDGNYQEHMNNREGKQDARIEQGMKSGRLNEKEAARLQRGQTRVDNAQARASADGDVTKREARHVNRMQNRQSRQIYRAKHNRR